MDRSVENVHFGGFVFRVMLAFSESRGWARIATILNLLRLRVPGSVVLETSLGNIQLELYWNHASRVHILYLSPEHDHNC